MRSEFIEVFTNRERNEFALICVDSILYITSKTEEKSRLYLVDGTIIDVFESYERLRYNLIIFRKGVENENLV